MVHLKNDGFQVRNLLTGTCFSGEPCQISGVQRLSRLFENVDGNIRGILPIRLKTPQEAGANTQRRKKTAACASCPGFVQVTQTWPLVVLVILIKLNATRFHHYIFKKSPSLKLAQHLKMEYVANFTCPQLRCFFGVYLPKKNSNFSQFSSGSSPPINLGYPARHTSFGRRPGCEICF